MESEPWRASMMKKQELCIEDQKRKEIARDCQKMFERIDDFLLNIDKLTNVSNPIYSRRIRKNLIKENYRKFSFRMLKQLAFEIIWNLRKISSRIDDKPMQTLLERVEYTSKQTIEVLSDYFFGLTIAIEGAEENIEKRQLLDRNMVTDTGRCSLQLDDAKREIDAKLFNCAVRSDYQSREILQKFTEIELPLYKFDQHFHGKEAKIIDSSAMHVVSESMENSLFVNSKGGLTTDMNRCSCEDDTKKILKRAYPYSQEACEATGNSSKEVTGSSDRHCIPPCENRKVKFMLSPTNFGTSQDPSKTHSRNQSSRKTFAKLQTEVNEYVKSDV